MRVLSSLPLLAGALLSVLSIGADARSGSLTKRGASRSLRHELFAKRDYPTPLQDPFYHRPDNLSSYKPGEVIRSRKITPTMKGIEGRVGDTWQIFYRTTNANNKPSSTVTTVIRPIQGGPPKMLSYHLWEDATQRDCAPSYTILKGDDSPNVKVVGDDVPIWFQFLLRNGISVVVPDYEGPKSALFGGFTAGYAILDSARAVRNFLNWPESMEVAMTGYSEGAHVTAWAANLAPSYAKDLNIVGVTHGGTPIDMELTLKHFDGSSFSGFSVGGMHGMMAAYPKFRKAINGVANAELQADLASIKKPPVCHAALRGELYANKAYMSMLAVPGGKSPYEWAPIREVLDRETLWDNKSTVGVGYPTFPRMIYHGNEDDVISYGAVKAYVEQQCAHGANIQFNVYEASAHTAPQLVIGGDLNAMRFVLEVFNLNGHSFKKVKCGYPTPSLLNAGTWAVNAILGGDIGGALGTVHDQITSFRSIGFGPHVNRTNDEDD